MWEAKPSISGKDNPRSKQTGSSPKHLLPSQKWSSGGAKENTSLTCLYPRLMICGWAEFNRPARASQKYYYWSMLRCNSFPLDFSHPLPGKSQGTKCVMGRGSRILYRLHAHHWSPVQRCHLGDGTKERKEGQNQLPHSLQQHWKPWHGCAISVFSSVCEKGGHDLIAIPSPA